MNRPRCALPPSEAAVLVAVLRGARDVSDVMAATGIPRTRTWRLLRALADEGLIVYAEGQKGTLRARLRVVRQAA